MAEAVKNNGRARRPPSHLRAQYNQDNFQPGASQYSKNRESQRQASDPCSLPLMARLLSKFMTSVNKKYLESKALKAQQEANAQTKKQANETSRSSYKVQKSSKEDRVATTPKAQISGQMGVAATKSKQVPQGYTNVTENKQTKNQNKTTDGLIKGNFPPDNLYSVQSMAKMSREQLLKMVPKGIDPTLFKQHTKQFQQQQTSKKQSKSLQSISKQNKTSMCRPDSKLFKRAAFHIGIAYNIHIDKVKQNNPNYSTDDLDPTLISKKMKAQSMQQAKRRMQEVERMRLQQEALARQRAQSQQNFRSQQGLNKSEKKPVFIEIEDENQSQMKQAIKGMDAPVNLQEQMQGNKQEKEQKMKKPSNMIEQEEEKDKSQMEVEMKERIENEGEQKMQENERIQQVDEIKMKQSNSHNENQVNEQMKDKPEQ